MSIRTRIVLNKIANHFDAMYNPLHKQADWLDSAANFVKKVPGTVGRAVKDAALNVVDPLQARKWVPRAIDAAGRGLAGSGEAEARMAKNMERMKQQQIGARRAQAAAASQKQPPATQAPAPQQATPKPAAPASSVTPAPTPVASAKPATPATPAAPAPTPAPAPKPSPATTAATTTVNTAAQGVGAAYDKAVDTVGNAVQGVGDVAQTTASIPGNVVGSTLSAVGLPGAGQVQRAINTPAEIVGNTVRGVGRFGGRLAKGDLKGAFMGAGNEIANDIGGLFRGWGR